MKSVSLSNYIIGPKLVGTSRHAGTLVVGPPDELFKTGTPSGRPAGPSDLSRRRKPPVTLAPRAPSPGGAAACKSSGYSLLPHSSAAPSGLGFGMGHSPDPSGPGYAGTALRAYGRHLDKNSRYGLSHVVRETLVTPNQLWDDNRITRIRNPSVTAGQSAEGEDPPKAVRTPGLGPAEIDNRKSEIGALRPRKS